ncbi:regulatory protein MerR [Pseudonocardia dioxanivorans CB1190]|uniref:Regulatory protein MerR n=1 Tax=Pseudonocardia dioxanivorans (strain ATCC 55486 / DSM 44775 / JCM 13855 / CB1190) TaxID=675635 RepID=F4D1F6_PSEUX|nr:MerR family DNA-binding transcriptional regulator [Pseudonocardia dioxanivorans]AEA27944.1 regulatory protein MerR [Pseudonocardia dioxanivorans CB1190]
MPYVSTGEAARALGVSMRSLQQWAKDGLIEPDFRTVGGHMRWDVERVRAELRANLRAMRDAAEADE